MERIIKTKHGHKFIKGPFEDCECPSHCESGDYSIEDFKNGLAFTSEEADQKLTRTNNASNNKEETKG